MYLKKCSNHFKTVHVWFHSTITVNSRGLTWIFVWYKPVLRLSLDGTLTHRRLAPSRRWYSFTYPGRMESWISLSRKEGRTNVQISAESGIELGTLWSCTDCADHAAISVHGQWCTVKSVFERFWNKSIHDSVRYNSKQ